MNTINKETKVLSIQSLESTLLKLTNALNSMKEKGSNTTLVEKRMNAVKVGLKSLKNDWNGEVFSYDEEIIYSAKEALLNIIPSIEKQIAKAKEGSSQKTLNERRLTAMKLAIQSLENRLTSAS
ncbi:MULTISPECIES: hypothetical protein [Ureibacillus]|jgi:hypothetical protein|uniref:hypothetical protein n=1 Tax=Ureibacillus TaxID=160795 RepID=UPI0002D7F625|nr:hypothetical protein [Ureibacillus thermosphaericus]